MTKETINQEAETEGDKFRKAKVVANRRTVSQAKEIVMTNSFAVLPTNDEIRKQNITNTQTTERRGSSRVPKNGGDGGHPIPNE